MSKNRTFPAEVRTFHVTVKRVKYIPRHSAFHMYLMELRSISSLVHLQIHLVVHGANLFVFILVTIIAINTV